MSTNKQANRLIHEKSPYLLQHAYNPVDWFPWSDEAFQKAKSEDKPIFLSIGYSTCHWCHVMERESFEDEEVARLLNKHFISIKVDREERPDIDSIYMSVCQALTGHGGWPMTIIMTPDARPFFAGTYFPKNDRMGLPGIITVLGSASKTWMENRHALEETGSEIIKAILSPDDDELADADGFNTASSHTDTGTQTETKTNKKATLDKKIPVTVTNNADKKIPAVSANNYTANNYTNIIHKAFEQYESSFDGIYGGFGRAPKFPSPHIMLFLLRYWKLYNNEAALKMVEKTLNSMRRGGIFDHIGFGFCRYSTDRSWLIPHFEKMLYDNALMAIANLEAYQATGDGTFARTAEEIFDYILRDMTSPEGGFYSAEDADSEGHEGLFYTWTPEEIREVLGENDANRFMILFDITAGGNFEGRNIPNTIKGSISDNDTAFAEGCRKRLFEFREERVHPFKDDKILTSWNGLMIAAMAMGGRVLGNERYTNAAEKAAEFILSRLINKNGRLLAVYRNGPSDLKGYADDYAFLIWGLLELFETGYKAFHLNKAIELNKLMLDLFWDNKRGGLFLYGHDSEQLIARPKESYDGATPSANSVAANNFIRLARLTGQYELENIAHQLINVFRSNIENYPAGFSYMLCAALQLEAGGTEVIISGETANGAGELLKIVRESFRPFTVSLYYNQKTAKDFENNGNLLPFLNNYSTVDGKAAAYVCRNFTCNRPVTKAEDLAEMLRG